MGNGEKHDLVSQLIAQPDPTQVGKEKGRKKEGEEDKANDLQK